MKKRLIEDSWEIYKTMVLPKEAGLLQVTETRKAFFAGATALWLAIMGDMEPGEEATPGDLETMQNIQDEIDAFMAQQRQGGKHATTN